jgi:hypothetical protein
MISLFYIIFATTMMSSVQMVHSYAPNPRAVHPNGKIPSTREALRKIPSVQKELFKTVPPIILIDGNNIRNSFGFQSVGALDLTEMLSSWSVDGSSRQSEGEKEEEQDESTLSEIKKPAIICVWDGGTKRSSYWTNSRDPYLSVFSGTEGNADDIIVQCCAYLSSHKATANRPIVVFTSDANLGNRCKMQAMDEGTTKVNCQIYHSIYLCLLLGGGDHTISSRNDEFSADWERQERRTSVDELENFFCDENHVSDIISSAKNDENDDEFNGDKVLKSVNKWINNGMNGIAIGRVTNGGSVLFKVSN